MRLLRAGQVTRRCGRRPGRRIYDEAVREALIVIWEASDRICGKRLRPLLPILVEAMERPSGEPEFMEDAFHLQLGWPGSGCRSVLGCALRVLGGEVERRPGGV
jgi:hypothetical protein